MSGKDMLILNKLEYLKEIKLRMDEMNKLRGRMHEEIDLINIEEKCLQEYRREMDSLYQEKMTHVEELRQIHSDINMLENVLKQSEEDRGRRMENIKMMQHQLGPLREVVDKMRSEIGLPRISDKEDDGFEATKLGDGLKQSRGYNKNNVIGEASSGVDSARGDCVPKAGKPFADNTNTGVTQSNLGASATSGTVPSSANHSSPFSSSLASLMSGFHHQDSGKHPAAAQSAFGRMLVGGGTGGSGSASQMIAPTFQESTAASQAAAFRQQPPPMKSCLSCHQQIHRNAPICPLCKAKSRSRHPKRRNNPKN